MLIYTLYNCQIYRKKKEFIYYFKSNTSSKIFDDFNISVELFKKIKAGEIKQKEVKKNAECV